MTPVKVPGYLPAAAVALLWASSNGAASFTGEQAANGKQLYDRLCADYAHLHDCFGRGKNDVMKRLKALEAESHAGA